MNRGIDFKIGYYKERINPGDDTHKMNKITRIVTGMEEETTEHLSELSVLLTNGV